MARSQTALQTGEKIERPPVIVIMGHIDHGKSTLLDFIRKSNIVANEAGSITQHLGAYEVLHKTEKGESKKITFLDTPGHAAFSAMRSRGARVADLAVLVVSAEDGVKPQTLEALSAINDAKLPYVVAITKIDKPNANVEKVKQDLAVNHVFLEGYGGTVPFVPISAKTGEGINELLDILLLVAELAELKADVSAPASGVVVEATTDTRQGCSAVIVIRDGTLHVGDALVVDGLVTPVRSITDHYGERLKSATVSAPVRVSGCTASLSVGSTFRAYSGKKAAEAAVKASSGVAIRMPAEGVGRAERDSGKDLSGIDTMPGPQSPEKTILPVVIKADVSGSLEAVKEEILKQSSETVSVEIIHSGVGPVGESDLKAASFGSSPLVIAFHVKVEKAAQTHAEQHRVTIHQFSVIYEVVDLVRAEVEHRRPREEVEETTGRLKVLKIFGKEKDKQVVGGVVLEGKIIDGAYVKVLRHERAITKGRIVELQSQKARVKEVTEETQCGLMVDSKLTIAPNDILEAFVVVTR